MAKKLLNNKRLLYSVGFLVGIVVLVMLGYRFFNVSEGAADVKKTEVKKLDKKTRKNKMTPILPDAEGNCPSGLRKVKETCVK